MEKLLELAKKKGCEAEIYSIKSDSASLSVTNDAIHDINNTITSGISMRIIKDGVLGFGYTKNLLDREAFLDNVLKSLHGGVKTEIKFPKTENLPVLDTYDESIEDLSIDKIAEKSLEINSYLRKETEAEAMVYGVKAVSEIRLLNTSGTDLSTKASIYVQTGSVKFSGTASGFSRSFGRKGFAEVPEDMLKKLVYFYKKSEEDAEPSSGRMKIVLMPSEHYALLWRIFSASSAKSLYDGITPLADKVGEKVFNSKISVISDSLDDEYPFARSFDDEGVPVSNFNVIENGVFKGFYNDLNYAAKLNMKPTGHGFKTARWGGDIVTLTPSPALNRTKFAVGEKSFEELISSIDKGIIVESVLGAHSGNISNGDFSVGVAAGLYVENGKIIGRVRDAMAAGNIYSVLNNDIEVSENISYSTKAPALMIDNVSVSAK